MYQETLVVSRHCHELRHALEVLSDLNVRRNRDMFFFFHREGPTGSERFETLEALHVGDRVALEACTRLKKVVTE
jgi:hypothetical protein